MSTITINDLGAWELYTPDTIPEAAPPNAIFTRRVSDGMDWYALVHDASKWAAGSLFATATPSPRGLIMQAIVRDPQRLFPANGHLVEIVGHDETDATPWKAYEQKVLDIAAGTITDPVIETPAVTRVSSAQATSALYRHDLLELAEGIARDHSYPPVRLFFQRSPYWEIDNPYVQAFAEELNLNAAQLQSLFDEAAKL